MGNAHILPTQEMPCNTLGLNLKPKRERGGCLQPTNLIFRFPLPSLDTLIINLPTQELSGFAIKDE